MSKPWGRLAAVLVLGLSAAWPLSSRAGETREQQFILGDNTDRIFVPGIRPLGMGGAQIAVADDENALFYNPAGLARLQYWRFTFPYYYVGIDTHSADNLMFWIKNAGNITQFPNVSPEVANGLVNTHIHLLDEGSLKYIGPNFGFGVYLLGDALAQSNAILVPQVSWNLEMSLIENISFGWGWDIPSFGYLAAGLSFKAVQRGFSNETLNALELANFSSVNLNQQWGGGMDLGVLYQPTKEITVAMQIADLYSRIGEEVQVPDFKLGFAYKPWWLNFEDLNTTLAVDLVELNWQGDNEFKNTPDNAAAINFSKLRAGVEFLLSGLVAIRGGISQGYPTAGFGLVTSFINLQWAYFGRELGSYPGQSPEWNQRISLDWHVGGPVVTPTLTPTPIPTATPTPEVTQTPTPTVTPEFTPTPRPTPQPTLTGNIPKLHGIFVGFTGTIMVVPKLPADATDISSWTMTITSTGGKILKRFAGSGTPPTSFTWNAKNARGERVSSKELYPFILTLNPGGVEKTVGGTLFIVDTIPKLYTSKNYELYPDKVYFSIKEPPKGTASWKLDLYDDANQVIRSFPSKDELFKAFAWDSKDESGNPVPNNASYRYELSVVDAAGNQIIIDDRVRPVLAEIYQSEGRNTIKIGNILFDTGKAFLTAEMFDKVIKSAYTIQDEPASEAVINGHTDSTGGAKMNMKLSLVRAESVRLFLIEQQNVPEYQMTIQGWGPTKPVATNKTPEGRRQNRRDEVVIKLPH